MSAVVAKKGRVVSVGFNSYKTHTRSPDPYHTLHAEIDALIKARQDVSGCDLYVFRAKKSGELGLARPCEHCLKVIKEVGIKNIYYTSSEGYKHEKV